MAETTYNITIPHTSPYIYYDDFSTECPDTDSNGSPVCDDAKGFHVAQNSTATMRLDFVGNAIYVYGSVDDGMQYSWSVNDAKKTIGQPNGTLLIAAENLKLEDFSPSFSLEISLTQFGAGKRFQFNKADVVVGTGVIGAQTFVNSYKTGNNSLRLMTGWTANDTISGYHYYQSNTGSSRSAILSFQGAAVWVWGFCGPRGQSSGYGSVSIDDGFNDDVAVTSSHDSWIDHKCLIYWQTGLNATQQHSITYSSESSNVLLDSIDVLQVVGGTGYESSATLTQALLPSRTSTSTTTSTTSTTSATSTPNSSDGTSTSIPTAAIIGSVVGALVLLGVIVPFIITVQNKRRQQRIPVVVHSQVPTYPPVSNQSQVPIYAPVSTQSQAPTYAPASRQSLFPTHTPQLPSSSTPPAAYYTPPAPAPASASAPRPFDYYSAPVTTSAPRLHEAPTAEEVNRLRQEMDAMMAAMQQQQHHQQNVPGHGEDGEYLPPPEYEPIAPSQPSSAWQPPSAPPPDKRRK